MIRIPFTNIAHGGNRRRSGVGGYGMDTYAMKLRPKDTGESCPACVTGRLIEKKGRYGVFVGCSNYPKCGYIRKDTPKLSPIEAATREFLKQKGELKKEYEL